MLRSIIGKLKAHDRDGSLDLVNPRGIIIDHILLIGRFFIINLLHKFTERFYDLNIILLSKRFRIRKISPFGCH